MCLHCWVWRWPSGWSTRVVPVETVAILKAILIFSYIFFLSGEAPAGRRMRALVTGGERRTTLDIASSSHFSLSLLRSEKEKIKTESIPCVFFLVQSLKI